MYYDAITETVNAMHPDMRLGGGRPNAPRRHAATHTPDMEEALALGAGIATVWAGEDDTPPPCTLSPQNIKSAASGKVGRQ